MTERPILFSGPMVRAVLDDSKTQTRRIVKPQPIGRPWFWEGDSVDPEPQWFDGYERGRAPCGAGIEDINKPIRCPYGQPGDRLWVRETWALLRGADSKEAYRGIPGSKPTEKNTVLGMVPVPIYAADGQRPDVVEPHFEAHRPMRWKPSIHMPRWASRITLEVTGVRVERLQDISEEDARAEGVNEFPIRFQDQRGRIRQATYHRMAESNKEAFQRLWRSVYGGDSWDANPWVWVVEFRRLP